MSYTYSQIEAIWIQYGGNPAAAPMAAAIALAESGGNPNAVNTANSNGTTDRGLWQINSVHGAQSTFDLAANTRAAIAISNNGANWRPWTTYNTGAYRKYYNSSVQPSPTPPGPTSGGVATGGTTNTPVGQTTDTAGVSLNNSPIAAFQAVNPSISLDALKSTYPLVAALIASVPELQNLFQVAVAQTLSVDAFIASVQNSNWWKTNSNTMRQAIALQQTDPATFNQNVGNLQASLTNMAAEFGAQISQGELNQLAVEAIQGGFDQNQAVLRQHFEQFIQPVSGLHFGGEAGTTESAIRNLQNQLGVFLPENVLDQNVRQITGGNSTVNAVGASLRTQAANLFPAYKNLINQGMNVSDIASPYINRAQQLLEGGQGLVNMQTPLIKQALQFTQNGTPTPMPLGDFEMAVRKDPRWLATDNAQNDLMSNAHKILQEFGLVY